MNIDTTGITYSRIYNNPPQRRVEQEQAPERTDRNEAIRPEPSGQSAAIRPEGTSDIRSKGSMSDFLNEEEKAMLNQLFPSSGLSVGVRAYKRVGAPVQAEAVLGRRLDVTT